MEKGLSNIKSKGLKSLGLLMSSGWDKELSLWTPNLSSMTSHTEKISYLLAKKEKILLSNPNKKYSKKKQVHLQITKLSTTDISNANSDVIIFLCRKQTM